MEGFIQLACNFLNAPFGDGQLRQSGKEKEIASSVILHKYHVEKLVPLFLDLVSKDDVGLSEEESVFVLFISTVCSD